MRRCLVIPIVPGTSFVYFGNIDTCNRDSIVWLAPDAHRVTSFGISLLVSYVGFATQRFEMALNTAEAVTYPPGRNVPDRPYRGWELIHSDLAVKF